MTSVKRHEVPIAIRALKTANIYEINSDKHILVDTGMSPASRDFLIQEGVDLTDLDMIVMTHLHVDHIGGAEAIKGDSGVPLAIGKADASRVRLIQEDPEGFKNFLSSQLLLNGTPSSTVSQIVGRHSVLDNVGLYKDIDFDVEFEGGENIAENVSIVRNPGHSPGSMSIILKDSSKLLTGDHLLPGITPNISFYDRDSDMLGLYISSLKETRKLEPSMILPGHRDPFEKGVERIDEILGHHRERLNEILVHSKEWSSAFDVASRIPWSRGRKLESMNLMEMNFGIGEAVTHLTYLANAGFTETRETDGVIQYRSNGQTVKDL